jgi:leucine dehydrogenase
VLAALRAVCAERFGSASFGGRTFALLGVGRVGAHIARALTAEGASLIAADVDAGRRSVVPSATWVSPSECLAAEADVLVPAALGGVLTASSVAGLRCAAVVGPANNQLDRPGTAALLQERGILWAPDVVVSAGGIIHAIGAELLGETAAQIDARLAGIGETMAAILREAREQNVSPAEAADRRAARLLTA